MNASCSACGNVYLHAAGHSCSDSVVTVQLREALVIERERNDKLELELSKVKKFLMPIAKFFTGEYTKWRCKYSKEPSYVEAGAFITNYIRESGINQK